MAFETPGRSPFFAVNISSLAAFKAKSRRVGRLSTMLSFFGIVIRGIVKVVVKCAFLGESHECDVSFAC